MLEGSILATNVSIIDFIIIKLYNFEFDIELFKILNFFLNPRMISEKQIVKTKNKDFIYTFVTNTLLTAVKNDSKQRKNLRFIRQNSKVRNIRFAPIFPC